MKMAFRIIISHRENKLDANPDIQWRASQLRKQWFISDSVGFKAIKGLKRVPFTK